MEEAPGEKPQTAASRARTSAKARKRGKEKPVKRPKVKKEPPSASAVAVVPADDSGARAEPERQQKPDERTAPQQHSRLRVLVLKDSGPYPRGCFWEDVLKGLGHDVKVRSLVEPDVFFIKDLKQYQVLIINWDAINGDPSFDADSALRWSEHRHPEVRWWVSNGGILIIEGQARLSVPTQAAYDALLGPGQVRVSGPSDPSQPGIEEKRVGTKCRVTKRVSEDAPLSKFRGKELSSEERMRTFENLFPCEAGDLLLPHGPTDVSVRGSGWNTLYRGWFKPWLRPPLGRWRLKWVRLVETADRAWYELPHATMMAAKDGDGAVFATTMVLSNINHDQVGFIDEILKYHNRVQDLPEPTRISSILQTHLRDVINLVVAVVFGLGLAIGPPGLLESIGEPVPLSSGLQPVFEWVLGLVLFVAVLALAYFALWLRRRLREMFGL
jgi:hypothetical protein